MTAPWLSCPACAQGYSIASGLFACPGSRPGEAHLLQRRLPDGAALGSEIRRGWEAGSRRTFGAFRFLLSGYHLLGEDGYRRMLDRLTERLLSLEGRGFDATPLVEAPALASALGRAGRVWVKDETGNVTGSHKGRHLWGSLLYLEALRERAGESRTKGLAIYSCGNAALAASAVARVGGYELHAFVPEEVDPQVAAMLAERGAVVERIARAATGEGDPCYLAFRRALAEHGWVPFACAGNDNWSNIEGGSTLGWELVMQLRDRGAALDCAVLQVGGGAMARAVAQALEEACALGLLPGLPRLLVCQPEGSFPFVRAYLLVLAEIARRNGLPFGLCARGSVPSLQELVAFSRSRQAEIRRAAAFARQAYDSPAVQGILDRLPVEPARFMWPWDGPAPRSLAHGILDDVTYDWYPLLRSVLRSGGQAEILEEDAIRTAHAMAQRRTGIPVCPTGAAGLAGLLQLQRSGAVEDGASVALFFTGFDRGRGR